MNFMSVTNLQSAHSRTEPVYTKSKQHSEVNHVTDKEIIALLDFEPSEGIRVIIEDYSSLVYTITYSKLGSILSTDDIEEFVGYIFSRVYESRGSIDFSRGSLKGYISTLAKRMCIDEYRKHGVRVKTVEMTDEQSEIIPDMRNMQEDVERSMDEKALVDALKMLRRKDRTVLVRRYYYNQTSAQIAKSMNMTDAAVRKRISRAIDKVRDILLNEGG